MTQRQLEGALKAHSLIKLIEAYVLGSSSERWASVPTESIQSELLQLGIYQSYRVRYSVFISDI